MLMKLLLTQQITEREVGVRSTRNLFQQTIKGLEGSVLLVLLLALESFISQSTKERTTVILLSYS